MNLRHRRPLALLVSVPCALAAGCSDIFGQSCTLEARPAIIVEIRHAQTSTPLADSARGSVVDGGFVDSLRPQGIDSLGRLVSRAAAIERAGTYTVSVTRSGYTNWTQSNVQATRGDCHVNTVRLTAALQPVP